MGKHRKIIAMALGATITATVSITGVQPALAAPQNYQSQINQAKGQQQQKKQQLNQVKEKEAETLQAVKKLEKQISDAENKINTVQASKEKTEKEVQKLKKEIIETEKRIQKRNKLLKDRVRYMYSNGSTVHYLEVVLGSQNFSDFLDRVFALHLIAKQDKQLLEAQKADKKKEEQEKTEIVKTLDKLQNQLDSLTSLKADLRNKTQEEKALLDQLKGKGDQIEKAIQDERAKINALLKKQEEAQRKAEEKARQEARERAERRAEQKAEQQSHTYGSVSSDDSSSSSDNTSQPSHSSNQSNDTNHKSNHSSSAASSSSHSHSGSVQDMVQASRRWIGNSVYVWGGGRTQAQIENGMFDCSAFVHWAYQQIGVNVGWSTTQLSHEGYAVSPSNMQPGDLVFFNTYKTNGHVGIYLGGGRFIDCENSYGVRITSLRSNPYWSAHFHGHVRRVL